MTNTNKKEVKDLQAPLNELHKLFDKANKELYNNELPNVVITIQSAGKTKSLGWFTVNPMWMVGDDSELHEINLSSEALKRDFVDIATTLLHEMIHLYCSVNGIKDTSRNYTYHNKRFKAEAEKHGMQYTHDGPDEKIGYSAVTLTQETIKKINKWGIKKEVFQLARKALGGTPQKKKTNIIKWVCPSCGDTVRSSKPSVRMVCVNDDEGMREPCMKMFQMDM